eukprot:4686598-Pyramimonas_sp.AAC.1
MASHTPKRWRRTGPGAHYDRQIIGYQPKVSPRARLRRCSIFPTSQSNSSGRFTKEGASHVRSDCGAREPGYEVGSAVLCS